VQLPALQPQVAREIAALPKLAHAAAQPHLSDSSSEMLDLAFKAAAEEPKKNSYGEFKADSAGQTVKLSWNRNEGAVLDESVTSLAAVQTSMGREGRSENIFRAVKDFQKVVRIEAGKTYIIKNGQLKDKWIYLLIDPEGKTTGYPAKAAGSEPESSVFYAKAITAPQAQKLIADNKGVTLFE